MYVKDFNFPSPPIDLLYSYIFIYDTFRLIWIQFLSLLPRVESVSSLEACTG